MRIVDDEGSGRLAVLLHGQPGSGADFARVVTALRGRGLRVISVDRPGYDGRPERATGFAGNATALHELLSSLVAPTDPVLLLGLSWGGGVALHFGQRYPHRVAGMVLAASVGGPRSVSFGDKVMARPLAGHIAERVLPLLGGLLERSSGSRLTPADRAFARHAARRWERAGGWQAFRVEQRALVAETSALWAELGERAVPITVVQGSRDGYVPPVAGRALAARLGARYVEVDAGHLLHLETPGLLAAELLALAGPSPTDAHGPSRA